MSITKASALAEIRRYAEQYSDWPPEVAAMSLMRRVEGWEEHRAVIAALDEALAQQQTLRTQV